MPKYSLTQKAVDDLSEIWNYTYDEWSESQADKYYELLDSAFTQIAEMPNIGKYYTEIAENILGFRVNKHIIFYQIIKSQQVEIIRILHGSMDLKSKMEE
jgi:toxin ParE1/3/4